MVHATFTTDFLKNIEIYNFFYYFSIMRDNDNITRCFIVEYRGPLVELTSCCGPQLVDAASPKWRSAKSAILNGAPGLCCSAVLSRLGSGSCACWRPSNPTVRINCKRIKTHVNDKTVEWANCRFMIGEGRAKESCWWSCWRNCGFVLFFGF